MPHLHPNPSCLVMRLLALTPILAILMGLGQIPLDAASPKSGAPNSSASARRMERYNVVWHSPSRDATGTMPIGNGDVAASVYVIANGDLYLLLAKNDAYTHQGDLFKTGRVRVSLNPNPFRGGREFRQTLDLPTGSIRIEADGVQFRIWADASRPVFHVEITAPHETEVAAQPEFWPRFEGCPANATNGYRPSTTSPVQDILLQRDGALLWYYAVGPRSIFEDDLAHYGIQHMRERFPDPLRFNTFGNLLTSPSLRLEQGILRGLGKRFDIRIHALAVQTPEPQAWIDNIVSAAASRGDTAADWRNHQAWWKLFWERSWIVASDTAVPLTAREVLSGEASPDGTRKELDGAALVAQSYNVFRFLMACQSRGRVQTKFNGGLFTQQLRVKSVGSQGRPGAIRQPDGTFLTHEDDRLWGRRFTFQNQRLLYWPLLASGDFDLLQPFFDYYGRLLPIRRAITQAWFGHEGAYYRENIEPTGGERDCGEADGRPPKTKPGENQGNGYYHSYYFTCGLEITAMMLDYVNHTGDNAFRDRVLVPFAREILEFFNRHYPREPDGKLRLDPAMVLETWWLAINPAPDIAGLRFCLDALLAMPAGTSIDRAAWSKLRSELPELTLHTIEGKSAIAPAKHWDVQKNAENGELYPVFPFRCFGLAQGTADIVDWTLRHRTVKDAFGSACWTQDQIHWAYAGNAHEAASGLVRRFRVASTMCRFPLFGREEPDSCPDFDHFGAGSIALQRMLVQEADDKITLLPAWPSHWDVDFKLHLARRTTVTGTVRNGELVAWDIHPRARKQEVVIHRLQPHKP